MNKNHQSNNPENKEWWIERLDYHGAENKQLVFDISQKFKVRPIISQVYMCQYSPAVLPEFGKQRPVVIVSKGFVRDEDVVTIVPITSSPQDKKEQKYWVKIKAPFDKDGNAWVLCNHITSVSKQRLSRHQSDINKFRKYKNKDPRKKPNWNQFITKIPDAEFQEIVKKVLDNLADRRN
ncbi:MAG: type II toxin-antitoxin system PemK/MazF family toxin [Rhodobacteraceae bacterium]|nr:type II toxin-antitoxin system PemK/MazF family toxin [Paracoccaceae bacterium]